jgi:hypothetical protein
MSSNNLFPFFPTEKEKEKPSSSALIQHGNTSWLKCSSAPSQNKDVSEDEEIQEETERKRIKKEKKRARKEEKEKLKIVEFEKKRIKIDPRSQPSLKDLFQK